MLGRLGPELVKTFVLKSHVGWVGGRCPAARSLTGQCSEHVLTVPMFGSAITPEICKALQEDVQNTGTLLRQLS